MCCVIKCIVHGNQARVKNADLRHPSCTVVMYRRKSASPVHNVLRFNADTICLYQKKYVMHPKIQLSGIQLAVPLVGYMFLKECYYGKETRCMFVIANSVTKAVVIFLCATGPVLMYYLCD